LLRQSVFGRLAGYEDVNDAERLCRDPAMRWVVGGRDRRDGCIDQPTSSVIWSAAPYGRETCTAPKVGAQCWSR